MLDGMSDSIQGSRIENLQSREVDRQSPMGLIFFPLLVLVAVCQLAVKRICYVTGIYVSKSNGLIMHGEHRIKPKAST